MNTYRNTKADLDSECTVVCFATGNKPAGDHWVECDDCEVEGYQSLYVQAGTRFYGNL